RQLHVAAREVRAAEHESMPLILGGRALFGVGIESEWQTPQVLRVPAAAVALRNERALKVRRVVLGLRQRVAAEELVAIGEPLRKRGRQSPIPCLAEGGVLKDRRQA